MLRNVQAATAERMDALGCLSVKKFGAAGDGVTDDTTAIRSCIKAGKLAEKAVWFPLGTYKVSDTLDFSTINIWNGARYQQVRDKVTQIIGSTRDGGRPRILLADNAPGFNDPANPKAVFFSQCRNVGGPNDRFNIGSNFNQGIRNLEIQMGAGNAGAVGIFFPGSQFCFLEDIRIDMTNGGYAGLSGLIGVAGSFGGIEIVGGRYGIITGGAQTSGYPGIAGVRLINQIEYALYHDCYPLCLVGFEIEKTSAPAIKTIQGAHTSWGGTTLVDGSIRIASDNGQAAIDNSAGVTLVMRNVYLQNAPKIVASLGQPVIEGGSGWHNVSEYVYGKPGIGINVVEGVQNTEVYSTVAASSAPPADIRTRHVWNLEDYPSPDDIYDRVHDSSYSKYDPEHYAIATEKGVVAANDTLLGFSGAECLTALQKVIDQYDTVLLPKGCYLVRDTLTLRDGTRLIGMGNSFTGIRNHDSYKPTATDRGTILTTVDSATADPKMAHLQVSFSFEYKPVDHDWFTGIRWRAGRHSEMHAVYTFPGLGDESAGRGHNTDLKVAGNPKHNWEFTGNGGGRHWGYCVGDDLRCRHSDYRVLCAEGTTEPLLFYNPNVEDGRGDYGSEFKNCRNVVIYGVKTEYQKAICFNSSQNCALFSGQGAMFALINNCENMYIAMLPTGHDGTKINEELQKEGYDATTVYRLSEAYDGVTRTWGPIEDLAAGGFKRGTLAVFKRGTINWDDVYIKQRQ